MSNYRFPGIISWHSHWGLAHKSLCFQIKINARANPRPKMMRMFWKDPQKCTGNRRANCAVRGVINDLLTLPINDAVTGLRCQGFPKSQGGEERSDNNNEIDGQKKSIVKVNTPGYQVYTSHRREWEAVWVMFGSAKDLQFLRFSVSPSLGFSRSFCTCNNCAGAVEIAGPNIQTSIVGMGIVTKKYARENDQVSPFVFLDKCS